MKGRVWEKERKLRETAIKTKKDEEEIKENNKKKEKKERKKGGNNNKRWCERIEERKGRNDLSKRKER